MAEQSKNRSRLSLYLVPDLYDYVTSQAEVYGMSISAYLTMVIQQYRMQSDSLSALAKALEVAEQQKK